MKRQIFFILMCFVVYVCIGIIHSCIRYGSPNISQLIEDGPRWIFGIYSMISIVVSFVFYEKISRKIRSGLISNKLMMWIFDA